jgi:hypothetical protein
MRIVQRTQKKKGWMNFHEIWYARYAMGQNKQFIPPYFLRSPIPT